MRDRPLDHVPGCCVCGLQIERSGETIRELFGGNIDAFIHLEEAGARSVFGGIRRLLFEQVERSSAAEQRVLRRLSVERPPVSVAALLAGLGPRLGRGSVIEALEALRRRSLVELALAPSSTLPQDWV